MTANKVPNVLAAACYNEALARNSREHNDANVLTLGSGQVTADQAKAIVDVFLTTACTAKRHRRRVDMIRDIERKALMAGGSGGNVDLSAEDLQRIADRVRQLLAGEPAGRPRPRRRRSPPDAARPDDRPHAAQARGDGGRHREALRRGEALRLLLGVREPDLRRRSARRSCAARRSRSAASSASRSARSRRRSRPSRRARRSATAPARSTW